MKKIRLPLFTWVLLMITGTVAAETVAHHGLTVNAEGTSTECSNCHSSDVGFDCGGSHAVDMAYPSTAPINFKSLDEVNVSRVRLLDGRISCISCHDLKSATAAHLVMSNEGSRLCTTCHNR